ncbi:hypothetical protein BD324DRAFT_607803 [Kockovaella imperatae]|uniref:RING-type domain-containing protein n=1 Tax=Kockovaella imperatae TaxID=4999 RepID=A0A1Y1UL86_9TREE|nr:hypothetical protein BD324DRAFT_607803 [Kockovaella imperatae]ORX38246.1 hypothetical protein BD324DRAFT_607803 [Kockovaella imperatae]
MGTSQSRLGGSRLQDGELHRDQEAFDGSLNEVSDGPPIPSSSIHRQRGGGGGESSKRGRGSITASSSASLNGSKKGNKRRNIQSEDELPAPALAADPSNTSQPTSSLRPTPLASTRTRSRTSILSRPVSQSSTEIRSGGALHRVMSRLRSHRSASSNSLASTGITASAAATPNLATRPAPITLHSTPSLPTSPGPPVLLSHLISPSLSSAQNDQPSSATLDPQQIARPDNTTLSMDDLVKRITEIESDLGPRIMSIFEDAGETDAERTCSTNLVKLYDHMSSETQQGRTLEEFDHMRRASEQLLQYRIQRQQIENHRLREENDRLRQAEARLEEILRDTEAEQQNPLARTDSPSDGSSTTPRVPAGAVLVIQGLVQTRAEISESETSTGATANSDTQSLSGVGSASDHGAESEEEISASWPRRSRRLANRGQASRRSSANTDVSELSLEAQVRTIGNLLNVAAAAISTTLLTPENSLRNRTRPRPSVSSTITSFLDRFRSPRRTSSPNVEAAIGDYLRNALRDSSGNYTNPGGTSSESSTTISGDGGLDLVTTVSDEFRGFLEGLQRDLVESLREFSLPSTETSTSQSPDIPQTEDDLSPAMDPVDSDAPVMSTPPAQDVHNAIPTFHHQPGQNPLPTVQGDATRTRTGISGGHDGLPRRLNFFRAHLFPPVRGTDPSIPAGPDDQDAMVPCVFVGVQSIRHGPDVTAEEMINHPDFPFPDGQVPPRAAAGTPASEAPPGTPEDDMTPGEMLDSAFASLSSNQPVDSALPSPANLEAPPPSPLSGASPTFLPPVTRPRRPSLRSRISRMISTARPDPPPPSGQANTYLVYVIGGNYPRNHPILRIPALMTGDPLTDEDMTLIGELLGNVKPPVATREEIESAGLRIVKGSEMVSLGEKGEILHNCLERCLICLSDYEPEDDCRILKCRHAYHKPCVDQWLSQGRNSCPACRTEAVNKSSPSTRSTAGPAQDSNIAETADQPTTSSINLQEVD